MASAANWQGALLVPQLAEVYLLLDHVSATAAARLPDLDQDPVFRGGQGSWIQQICEIRWPPDPALPQNEPLNATKLLRAKDALNAIALPASGASIAYTLMLTGETEKTRIWEVVRGWFRRDQPARAEPERDPRDRLSVDLATPRSSLAQIAYPALERDAWMWRWTYPLLFVTLITVLVMTCVLSWRAAAGSNMLNRVTALTTTTHQDTVAETVVRTPADQDAADHVAYLQLKVASQNLGRFVEDNHGLAAWIAGKSQRPYFRERALPDRRFTNLEWASVFIGVLAGTVLPIFYGLLGAATAVVRNFSTRMSTSTLTPRAVRAAFVQLGLGAVIGACVGLFVTSDGSAAGEQGLLGPVRLSSSALCFLAGFGVEGVFRALEALVLRVFPAGSTPPPPERPSDKPVTR